MDRHVLAKSVQKTLLMKQRNLQAQPGSPLDRPAYNPRPAHDNKSYARSGRGVSVSLTRLLIRRHRQSLSVDVFAQSGLTSTGIPATFSRHLLHMLRAEYV